MIKIENRKPLATESGVLSDHPAVKTPWGKLISFRESYRYAIHHNAHMGATFMQVLRIVVPDYETRVDAICEVNRPKYEEIYSMASFQNVEREAKCIHPFIRGGYTNPFAADHGDEGLFMCGRVNDFGTYRTEKELDTCPWDVCGSEYCRCTTNYTQGMNDGWAKSVPGSPSLDYHMVEARGCGDRHCRLIGESREKWPMPEHKAWECFGPIATDDLKKFTPDEECYDDPEIFRAECDFLYHGPTDSAFTGAEMYEAMAALPECTNSVIPTLYAMEKDEAFIENVTKCVFEAAGKASFYEPSAVKGMREWLGVPGGLNDGRVLGGFIEVVLQSILFEYKIVQFDEEAAIYEFSRHDLGRRIPLLCKAYLWMWHGMVKTLVGAEWSVWEDVDNEPDENTLRLVIGKRVDKRM